MTPSFPTRRSSDLVRTLRAGVMSTPHADVDDADRLARIKLSSAIEPGDLRVTGLVGELGAVKVLDRSEEHTSELQSLMRISYAVFCLKKKTIKNEKA